MSRYWLGGYGLKNERQYKVGIEIKIYPTDPPTDIGTWRVEIGYPRDGWDTFTTLYCQDFHNALERLQEWWDN